MASLRQRPGPGGRRVWQVRVKRRGYPEMARTFDLKTEAEAWARQIESEMDRGIFVSRAEAENTSLAEALERYAREVLPGKKSRRVILSQIKYLTPRLGHLALSAITSSTLARYRDQRLADGAAAQTAKHDLSLISRVLNTAIKEWGIALPAGNPVLQIKMPRVANARDRRLVGDEYARLMGAAETYGGEIGPLITWAIETAMRRGEIAAMRWEHLDGPSGPQCRKARVLLIPETKTGTPRRIPLSTAAVATLNALPRRPDGHVWSMRPDSISQAFERVCKAAGIEGLTFHDLRHEAASRLSEKGFEAMEVAAITGHKTMQMVKRYTHFRAEDLVGRLD